MSSCIAGRDEERGGGRAGPQLAAPFSLITLLGMTGEEEVARGAGCVSVNAWRRVECVLNPTKRAHAQYLPLPPTPAAATLLGRTACLPWFDTLPRGSGKLVK